MYTLYTIADMDCQYCEKAERLLAENLVEYEIIEADRNDENDPYWRLFKTNRWSTVPQIVKGGIHIGGYTDLVQHFRTGHYKSRRYEEV